MNISMMVNLKAIKALNDNGDENGNDFNCKCGRPPAVDGISS